MTQSKRFFAILLVITTMISCMPISITANADDAEQIGAHKKTYTEGENTSFGLIGDRAHEIVYNNQVEIVTDTICLDSFQDAKEYLRDGIINRTLPQSTECALVASVAFPASTISLDKSELIGEELRAFIFEHTDNPKGGDFLLHSVRRDEILYASEIINGITYWVVDLTFEYYFTHEQDKELDVAVDNLISELNIRDGSEYEKVRAIYDWICLNVTYDFSYTCYDAYGALCKRTAVCAGYASLFYRLCLEVGIDCRYCGGYSMTMWGEVESHGWNVVQVDGMYYFVDSTWGAGLVNGEIDYYYFLKGTSGLQDHLIPASRWDNEIADYCIVATEDYPIPEKGIVISYGYLSDTIAWKITRAGVLEITGTGELVYNHQDWGQYTSLVKEIRIGEGITAIGKDMFYGINAAAVNLPDSLTIIGENAFHEGLTSVRIPQNVKVIEPGAFQPRDLNSFYVDPNNPYYTAVDGCLFSKDKKTLICYAGIIDEDGDLIREYQVPEGVETISGRAFDNQDMLHEIILPSSLKRIEYRAFFQCTYLATIELTDSITYIGDEVFADCHSIETFYIGKCVETIGENAFGSSRLKNISCHADNQHYMCVDNVLFNQSMTELIRYPVGSPITAYTIPEGVTSIASAAFCGMETALIKGANLETVVFPETLQVIGKSAFTGQKKISSLEFPMNLEVIEASAFSSLNQVDVIIIPDSVVKIGIRAFAGNEANQIYIGTGLKEIGYGAFSSANDSENVQVLFAGLPPTVVGNSEDGSIFNKATLYYPAEFQALWDPLCTGIWSLDADCVLKAYHQHEDNEIHFYELSAQGVICEGPTTFTYSCTLCHDSFVVEFAVTEHDWVEATCTSPKRCNFCGKTEGQPLGCTYDLSKSVIIGNVCTGYGKVIDICVICGREQETVYSCRGHWWEEATCEDPMTCPYCGEQTGAPLGHTLVSTECEAIKMCTVCFKYEGEHDWIEATYTQSKKCSLCGASSGYPLDHNYEISIMQPTCDAEGYTTHTCIACGYCYESDFTAPTGHAAGEALTENQRADGSYDLVVYCKDCGAELSREHQEGYVPGDINGDGTLDNKDLTRLFQYLSDWDVEVSADTLDINGDGSVNNKDLTRLFQYLSGWDVEIH